MSEKTIETPFTSEDYIVVTIGAICVYIIGLWGIHAVIGAGVLVMAGAWVAGRVFGRRGNDKARSWAEHVFIVATVACILGNLAMIAE